MCVRAHLRARVYFKKCKKKFLFGGGGSEREREGERDKRACAHGARNMSKP